MTANTIAGLSVWGAAAVVWAAVAITLYRERRNHR
jgi:hypothetical protein